MRVGSMSTLTPRMQTDAAITPLAYSRQQAADLMGVHVRTIDKWIREGTLRSVMVGGRRYIARTTLEALLEGTPAHDTPA